MNYFTPEELDQRKDIRHAEKGGRDYVEKIKYTRERTGMSLREAKDLVDYAPGLSAGEIVERWKANRATGINISNDSLPTICWRVYGCKYPELDGFYTELSPSLQGLIATGGGHAFELTSKSEALSKMSLAVGLTPLTDEATS
jgi:hypothetical protein